MFSKEITKHLFDSHAHISSFEFEKDIDQILNSAKDNGVMSIMDMSVNFESSLKSIELSKRFPKQVYSFVGIDPEIFIKDSPFYMDILNDSKWFEEQFENLSKIVEQNPEYVIGIGETGIDNFHNEINLKENKITKDDEERSSLLQEKLFRVHLELSQKLKLPLSIHSRKAESQCIQIAKEYDCTGIFHSFTGTYAEAKKILDSGFGLGVNGIITFKNAGDLREMYRKILGKIPEDADPQYFYSRGIFFETDSPFLSPDGKRGERNEPANVADIYKKFREWV